MTTNKIYRFFFIFGLSPLLSHCGGSGGGTATNISVEKNIPRVAWTVPNTRENGTPLSPGEIKNYYLQIINKKTDNEEIILIEDTKTSSYSFESFTNGDYEVRISTVDTNGLYSDFSNPVNISIQ